jgi:hypothetical protein
VNTDLSYENYGPWYRSQPPEVQADLLRERLDPESVNQEVKRLAEIGKGDRSYKTKVVYAAFYWSSDESTRKTLRENDLHTPKDDFGIVKSNRNESDPGESSSARTESSEVREHQSDLLHELFSDSASTEKLEAYIEMRVAKEVEIRVAHNIQQIVGVFLSASNAKISAAGLAFAAGLSALNGLQSQTHFARLIGVSKGAISKSTRFWKVLLDLPANQHMKTDDACESYSEAQKKSHWRNRPYGTDSNN